MLRNAGEANGLHCVEWPAGTGVAAGDTGWWDEGTDPMAVHVAFAE